MKRVSMTAKGLFWWIATVLYMAVIFYLSSKHGGEIQLVAPDYLLHAIEYGGLSFCVSQALEKTWPEVNHYLFAILIATVYGVTDEFHQSFVPGRDASVADICADFVGAVIMQFLLRSYSRLTRQRKR